MSSLHIGPHRVGDGHPLFVIAEIGLNHGGSLDRALELVDAAAAAGVSAIKLQTLVATELIAPACPAPAHVAAESLQEFFATFELDEPAHRAIVARARAHGLAVMATPFSHSAVAMLERIGIDAFKIASGDLTWTGLIERCARAGLPMILSTGMATIDDVSAAVAVARDAGAAAIGLLHCVSAYPVPHGSENLRAIATLAQAFGLPVGLSDHAPDAFAVPIAVALGASMYERHLVRDSDADAVDRAVSSTPAEFAAIVRTAARATAALGAGDKTCLPAEAVNVTASRRGLYAARPLSAGDVITEDDVIALRPVSELAPDRERHLIGTTLTRDLAAGQPFLIADLRRESRIPNRESRDAHGGNLSAATEPMETSFDHDSPRAPRRSRSDLRDAIDSRTSSAEPRLVSTPHPHRDFA